MKQMTKRPKIMKRNKFDTLSDYIRYLKGIYRQAQQLKRWIAEELDKFDETDYTS